MIFSIFPESEFTGCKISRNYKASPVMRPAPVNLALPGWTKLISTKNRQLKKFYTAGSCKTGENYIFRFYYLPASRKYELPEKIPLTAAQPADAIIHLNSEAIPHLFPEPAAG